MKSFFMVLVLLIGSVFPTTPARADYQFGCELVYSDVVMTFFLLCWVGQNQWDPHPAIEIIEVGN